MGAKKAVVISGFGVEAKQRDAKFGATMTYGKMKLLSLIVAKMPGARADLGMTATQRLNWEYGGWTPEMVEKAHEVIDKYVAKLPPRTEIVDNRSKLIYR